MASMDNWFLQSVDSQVNIPLCVFRAQDQASMQLSEMEEEMDQRIHFTERKTREQVGHVYTLLQTHVWTWLCDIGG